jgi:hypothetical protein
VQMWNTSRHEVMHTQYNSFNIQCSKHDFTVHTVIILHSVASVSPEVSSRIKLLVNTASNWHKFFLYLLTLSLLMSYIYGAPSKARNLTLCIYGRDFLLRILLLEPCILLICAWKTDKYTNYSFSLLIIYGSSYMLRHYIAICRERS